MSRQKAGRASDAFGRLDTAKQTAPVVGGEPLANGPAQKKPGAGVEPIRRFTVRFYGHADTDALDTWLMQGRKMVGSKIDASRLVRELLRELAADAALTARIHARLRSEESPPP